MEAAPVAAPTKIVNEDDEEYAPDDAEKEEAALAEARRKKQEAEAAARDTDALRRDATKRMGMLDSLLDKTAMYSQFVSSNIKMVDTKKKKKAAADEEESEEESGDEEEEDEEGEGATRSGKKRSAAASPKKKVRAKKAKKKEKFDLNQLDAQESADALRQDMPVGWELGLTEEGMNCYNDGSTKKTLIVGDMRDYQMQGVQWLISLWDNGMNGILGDEMGLGKTLQTIGMMAHLKVKAVGTPFLVVAPLSTLDNWFREVGKWSGGEMIPQVYHGPQADRDALRTEWGKCDVIITSFEVVMRDIKYFQRPNFTTADGKLRANPTEWKYLTIDEGHRLKNKDCRLIRELKTINSANRLLLSGTPLQNDLTELWALLNFLLPNIFDDLRSFQSWFDFAQESMEDTDRIIGMESQNKLVSKLHMILRPFLLRRQKKDVDLDIPPKKELILYCKNTELQNEIYTNVLQYRSVTVPDSSDDDDDLGKRERTAVCYDEGAVTDREFMRAADKGEDLDALAAAKVLKKHGSGKAHIGHLGPHGQGKAKAATAKTTTSLNNMMMQLRKVCNHPWLFPEIDPNAEIGATDERLVEACGKMKLLDRLLPKLRAGKHKVLIFSQMTQMLGILEDYLLLRGYHCPSGKKDNPGPAARPGQPGYRRLDGGVGRHDRQRFMDDFNDDPAVSVFLLSTRAGGLGINLVSADTVIIYDSDWNPQADLQAQDRCHRIGQKNPVLVYRLCMAGTVEEKMLERAANKRKLEHMVVSNGKFVTAGATAKASAVKAMNADDLMELLKDNYADGKVTTDTDKGAMSEKDLARILDRSDLSYKVGKKKKGKVAAADAAESSAFKVVEQAESDGLLAF